MHSFIRGLIYIENERKTKGFHRAFSECCISEVADGVVTSSFFLLIQSWVYWRMFLQSSLLFYYGNRKYINGRSQTKFSLCNFDELGLTPKPTVGPIASPFSKLKSSPKFLNASSLRLCNQTKMLLVQPNPLQTKPPFIPFQ